MLKVCLTVFSVITITNKLKEKLKRHLKMLSNCVIFLLSGDAIATLCRKGDKSDQTITDQKSGLKITILNLLKINEKYLIGYFLMKNEEEKSKKVSDFLQVISKSLMLHSYLRLFRCWRNSLLKKISRWIK